MFKIKLAILLLVPALLTGLAHAQTNYDPLNNGTYTLNNTSGSGVTGSLTGAGLVLSTNTALSNVGVTVSRLSLDNGANFVGDVYISGLNMSGQTITINGK